MSLSIGRVAVGDAETERALRDVLSELGAPPGVLTGGTEGQPDFQQLEESMYQQLDQAPPDQQGDWKPQCCSCVISCEVGTSGGTGTFRMMTFAPGRADFVGRDATSLTASVSMPFSERITCRSPGPPTLVTQMLVEKSVRRSDPAAAPSGTRLPGVTIFVRYV